MEKISVETVRQHLFRREISERRRMAKLLRNRMAEIYDGPICAGDQFTGPDASAIVWGIVDGFIELRNYDSVCCGRDKPTTHIMLIGEFRRQWRLSERNPRGRVLAGAVK